MQTTTVGRLLVNQALPHDLRDPELVLDKKNLLRVMREIAVRYPDQYREISKKLADIGRDAGTETAAYNFGLDDLRPTATGRRRLEALRRRVYDIIDDDRLTDAQKSAKIILEAGKVQKELLDSVVDEALAHNNALAKQVISGARGNKVSLNSLLHGDVLYVDHHDRVIPLPVLRSYAQGLSFMDYWAGSYGARRGTVAKRLATQESGFLAKQLNQVAHRLMVVDQDEPDQPDRPLRGLPVDVDDPDNEGALLAQDTAGYPRNTPLTPKILADLKRRNIKTILVRSPLVSHAEGDGVYARDVGIREHGRLAGRGEQVGLVAAQALSEPLTQGQLSARHTGGVAGQEKAVSSLSIVNALVQVPQTFAGVAVHSTQDGQVERIESAPAGGQYVFIAGQRHYVPPYRQLKVKVGDQIEAGDVLTDGLPHPAVVVQYKGIGEGRRYFTDTFRQVMKDSNLTVHRRNVELLARGLINHVRLKEEWEGHVPDDVVPYSTVERLYRPRQDAQSVRPERALGKYLERPVLHYTIGTVVRPSVLRTLRQFGVQQITVHDKPPPFQAEMIRGMESLQHDPDWITRMYGSGLKRSLLDAVHYGSTSDETSTSFVPGLARAVDFGRIGLVRAPQPGVPPPVDPEAAYRQVHGTKAASSWFGVNKKQTTNTTSNAAATKQTTPAKPGAPAPGQAGQAQAQPQPQPPPASLIGPQISVAPQPQPFDPRMWSNPAIYQAIIGHPSGDYRLGQGGYYGAVTRLGTFLGPQDMATLTRGPTATTTGQTTAVNPYTVYHEQFMSSPAASTASSATAAAGQSGTGTPAAASAAGASGAAQQTPQNAPGMGPMGIPSAGWTAGSESLLAGIRYLWNWARGVPNTSFMALWRPAMRRVPYVEAILGGLQFGGDVLFDENWNLRSWSDMWRQSERRAANRWSGVMRIGEDPTRLITEPLTSAGALLDVVFNPVENLNFVMHGLGETGKMVSDVYNLASESLAQASSNRSEQAMRAYLQQKAQGIRNGMANPYNNAPLAAQIPGIGLYFQQQHDAQLDKVRQEYQNNLRAKYFLDLYQRWVQAGRPAGQWTDPESTVTYADKRQLLQQVMRELQQAQVKPDVLSLLERDLAGGSSP